MHQKTIKKLVLTSALSLLAFAGVQAQAPVSGGKGAAPVEKPVPPSKSDFKNNEAGYEAAKAAYKAQMAAQHQQQNAAASPERVAPDPTKTVISYEEYQNMSPAKRQDYLNDSRYHVETSPR